MDCGQIFAAMLGATIVGLLWFLSACPNSKQWLRVQVVKIMLKGMEGEEKLYLRKFLSSPSPKAKDDCDADTWSVVSVASDTSPSPCIPVQSPPLESFKAVSGCKHKHRTSLGSNQFGRQIRCKDCGKLLIKTLNSAKAKEPETVALG